MLLSSLLLFSSSSSSSSSSLSHSHHQYWYYQVQTSSTASHWVSSTLSHIRISSSTENSTSRLRFLFHYCLLSRVYKIHSLVDLCHFIASAKSGWHSAFIFRWWTCFRILNCKIEKICSVGKTKEKMKIKKSVILSSLRSRMPFWCVTKYSHTEV